MIKTLKNILFSNKNLCYLCKENSNSKDRYICFDCFEKMEILDNKYEIPIKYLDDIYYSALYNKFNRDLVTNFKFNDKSYLHKPIGQVMSETLNHIDIKDIDIIIPVPIYKIKKTKRGYNQSELLALYVGDKMGIEVNIDILIKNKNTKPQSSLDSIDRMSNLEESLIVKNLHLLKDKKILLVDDIVTTGSTLSNCAKLLKISGAKKVIGLTFLSTIN